MGPEAMDAKREKRPKPTTCRMFDTPLIEFFSRIHPLSPFAFWVPLLGGILAWSISAGTSPMLAAVLFVVGLFAWTLFEYGLHRYVFHFVGPKPWQRRFHFVFHGVHHDFPQDSRRLVMPLGVSIPIGLFFFLLADALTPLPIACALLAGFGTGYLLYDGLHYFTHHLRAKSRLGKYLKKYHLVHHHTGVEGKWGVTTPIWDYAFGTVEETRRGPEVEEAA
jgi:sterol desaturase/sphingolipid hydroxylase (fatty acid hydroxylase superfamily)